MLKDPQEIVQIWSEALTKASTALVSASLMGAEVEKTEIEVTIEIPDPLYEAITEAAEKTGIDPNTVLQKMASEGFQHSLEEKLSVGKALSAGPTATENAPLELLSQLKAGGMNTVDLEGKMNTFKDQMTMLRKMMEMMEDATAGTEPEDDDQGKSP